MRYAVKSTLALLRVNPAKLIAVLAAVACRCLRELTDRIRQYGEKRVNMVMVLENKTDKDIQGVKATLKFTDIFGDHIRNIKFSYDDGIGAKNTATYKGSSGTIPMLTPKASLPSASALSMATA
jgi:hypothetical protein